MAEQEAEIKRLRRSLGALWVAVSEDGGQTLGAIDDGTERPPVSEEPAASRRDLLRMGAVALGTTAAAAFGARPVKAANLDPLLLGTTGNNCTSNTWIRQTAVNADGLRVWTSNTEGFSNAIEGFADAPGGVGVYGNHGHPTGAGSGVRGVATSVNAIAVRGTNSGGGTAVRGELPGSATANGIAVYGLNNSSFAGPSLGAGGFGVYGLSAKGHGLVGATATAGGAAVVGATNGVAGAWAGAFYGPVIVSGDFIVVGGAKSAAVPHPDGTHRQLYCVESPESWLEDFGTGDLVNGRAVVPIEPGFAAVADIASYHVFLTAYDHDHQLHVTKRTRDGFTVEADTALAALKGRKETELAGTFSWRVVAKRKDIVGARLAKVTMPPEPVLPPIEVRTLTTRNVDGLDGAAP
jgi:hypothetical protein